MVHTLATSGGMVQLSPDTRLDGWDGCGYHYSDSSYMDLATLTLRQELVIGDILIMPCTQFKNADKWRIGINEFRKSMILNMLMPVITLLI